MEDSSESNPNATEDENNESVSDESEQEQQKKKEAPKPTEGSDEPIIELEPVVEETSEAAPEPKPEVAPEPEQEPTPEPVVEAAAESTTEVLSEPTPEAASEPAPEDTPEPEPEATPEEESEPEPVPEDTPEPEPEPTPEPEITTESKSEEISLFEPEQPSEPEPEVTSEPEPEASAEEAAEPNAEEISLLEPEQPSEPAAESESTSFLELDADTQQRMKDIEEAEAVAAEEEEPVEVGIFAVKTSIGHEKMVANWLAIRARKRKVGVYSILSPPKLRGYLLLECVKNKEALQDLIKGVQHARSVVEGDTSLDEIEHFLTPKPLVSGIEEGDVVEIIAGPFKGEKAKVTQIDEPKEEITVELFEAMVSIPVTIRGDHVRILEKEMK